ncbi:hypothetical protein OQX63_13380 [Pedobacter sp. PF22-3]|nr:hypothetical protein [Pedobacter sp. PF22-3]MCX2494474.1 hypothetical protein [Pedobacter sp. PF22-3]
MDKLFEARRKNYIEIGKIYFWTATINKWQKLLSLGSCLHEQKFIKIK